MTWGDKLWAISALKPHIIIIVVQSVLLQLYRRVGDISIYTEHTTLDYSPVRVKTQEKCTTENTNNNQDKDPHGTTNSSNDGSNWDWLSGFHTECGHMTWDTHSHSVLCSSHRYQSDIIFTSGNIRYLKVDQPFMSTNIVTLNKFISASPLIRDICIRSTIV